jgi:purine-binding chemotaxis protein CheW
MTSQSLTSTSVTSASASDAVAAMAAMAHTLQFITFTLDAQEYGVDIMMVREIKGWTATTAIPNAPPHVRGVINLRGIIVPIFDLRARFGMGQTNPSKMHVVIIVMIGTRTIGLLVDAVSDIISIEPGAIRPVPDMGVQTDERFLEGLVALEDRMVTLVSLEGLFRDKAAITAVESLTKQ